MLIHLHHCLCFFLIFLRYSFWAYDFYSGTKSEQEAYDSEVKRKKAEDEKEAREDTKVEYDESDDLDYWPEDWEDEAEGD